MAGCRGEGAPRAPCRGWPTRTRQYVDPVDAAGSSAFGPRLSLLLSSVRISPHGSSFRRRLRRRRGTEGHGRVVRREPDGTRGAHIPAHCRRRSSCARTARRMAAAPRGLRLVVVSSGADPDGPKLPCATTASTRCHMDLFTLLGPLDPDVTPDRCKLHLATWNGLHDPLDLYLEGVFDEWQSDQNRRNFSRCDFIVALIAMPEPDLWLFAGVHGVLGEEPRDGEDRVHYRTSRRTARRARWPPGGRLQEDQPTALPLRREARLSVDGPRHSAREAGDRGVPGLQVGPVDEAPSSITSSTPGPGRTSMCGWSGGRCPRSSTAACCRRA